MECDVLMGSSYPFHFILVHGIKTSDTFMERLGVKLLEHQIGTYEIHNLYTKGICSGLIQMAKEQFSINHSKSNTLAQAITAANEKRKHANIVAIGHSGGCILAINAGKHLGKMNSPDGLSMIISIGGADITNGSSVPRRRIIGKWDVLAFRTRSDTYIKVKGFDHVNYFRKHNINTTFNAVIKQLEIFFPLS